MTMSEYDMLKWTCRRIKEKFYGLNDVNIDTHYNINDNGGRVKNMSIDVTIGFTIPEKNIALLDDDIDKIREIVEDLVKED